MKYKRQLFQVTQESTLKSCLQSVNVEPKEPETVQILKEAIKKSPPNQLKYLKLPAIRFTEPTLPLKITNLSKQPKFEPPKATHPDIRTAPETHRKLVLLKTKDQLIELNNNDINSVEETSNLQPKKKEFKPKFYRMITHDPTKTGRVRKQNHSQLVEDHVVPVSTHNKTHCPEFGGLGGDAGDVFGLQYPCPNYSCKRCQRSFICRKYFCNHSSKHRMKKFECFCCFKIYVYRSGLIQHIKMEHGNSELLRKILRCEFGHSRH